MGQASKSIQRPLTIVLVLDCIGNRGNGTSNSALQYAEELHKLGITVRLVGTGADTYDFAEMIQVPERHIPIISHMAAKQQMRFAQPDERILRKTFQGADVVHIYMPFTFGRTAYKVARDMGIPVSAGFHIQPENVLYSAGLLRYIPGLPRLIYRLFRVWLYGKIAHIHVPTRMGAQLLRSHGYHANIHVISNGYEPRYCVSTSAQSAAPATELQPTSYSYKAEPPQVHSTQTGAQHTFHIVASGRLSREKRHITLLKAVARCKHRNAIRLTIAGAGPLQHLLRLQARILLRAQHGYTRVPCSIGFHNNATMPDLLRSAQLLVHPSIVDLESISVLEGVACGVVPVIAQSSLSAASQFALTEQSLFAVDDPQALADRIDWWIEHPDELAQWSSRYAQSALDHYSIEACVRKFLAMEQQTIEDAQVYDTRKRS